MWKHVSTFYFYYSMDKETKRTIRTEQSESSKKYVNLIINKKINIISIQNPQINGKISYKTYLIDFYVILEKEEKR